MGAAFGNVCFPDLATAQDAYFQSAAPVFLPSGSTVSFQFTGGVWQRVDTSSSGLITSSLAPLPALAACDRMAGFNDGLLIASLLAAAIIGASMFGFISKAK